MQKLDQAHIKSFQKKILKLGQTHSRPDLPWRKARGPYRVLLSEYMLQQTQVSRVIGKLKEFIKAAPTITRLAALSQREILQLWQGLGYNSRALRLHQTAKEISENYGGKIPSHRNTLVSLPGIGPYTAGAIRVFAWNLPDTFIETNIRRVFIYEFFSNKKKVDDKQILELIEQTLYTKDPRTWYESLMDYGATLPKILKGNPNIKSKHYTKQSTFKGSDRQLRGEILRRALSGQKISAKVLREKPERVRKILTNLRKEGFDL